MVASWAEAAVFARVIRRRTGLALERLILVPVSIGIAASLLGFAVAPATSGLAEGIAAAVVAAAGFAALSLAFNRADFLASARRVRSLR